MKRRVWTHRAGKPSPDAGRESQVRFSGGHLKSFYRITGAERKADAGLGRGKCVNKKKVPRDEEADCEQGTVKNPGQLEH